MARIDVDDRQVRIRLTTIEKLFALRGDLTFPRAAVRSVERFDEALDAVRGIRAPGLGVPGRVMIGTWRRRDGKDLVVARRGEPGVRIELEGQRFAAVVVGGDDVEVAVAALG